MQTARDGAALLGGLIDNEVKNDEQASYEAGIHSGQPDLTYRGAVIAAAFTR